mmetsp:Transcript_10383/g.38527  ORF Transcript_10383/g.38527 Transcript_10383/m.38527 type:complete len:117 (+) Transcript_10383:1046-1396(+)
MILNPSAGARRDKRGKNDQLDKRTLVLDTNKFLITTFRSDVTISDNLTKKMWLVIRPSSRRESQNFDAPKLTSQHNKSRLLHLWHLDENTDHEKLRYDLSILSMPFDKVLDSVFEL